MVPNWISKRTGITFTFDLKTCFKVIAHHLLWYALNVKYEPDRAKEKRIWSSKDFFFCYRSLIWPWNCSRKNNCRKVLCWNTKPNPKFYIIKFILNANITFTMYFHCLLKTFKSNKKQQKLHKNCCTYILKMQCSHWFDFIECPGIGHL